MSIALLKNEVSLCSLPLELVLKVRIQNPNARENDFIEVELDRQELTYRSLLRVCCRELDISAEHVEKIRKLPNTMLRKVGERRPANCAQVHAVVQCHVHTREPSVLCMLQQMHTWIQKCLAPSALLSRFLHEYSLRREVFKLDGTDT